MKSNTQTVSNSGIFEPRTVKDRRFVERTLDEMAEERIQNENPHVRPLEVVG